MSRRRESIQIFYGILGTFILHIVVLTVLGIIGSILNAISMAINVPSVYSSVSSTLFLIGLFAVFGVGIFQLLYIIPVVLVLKRRQQWALMKGMIIGAVITALLNGSCYLLLLSQSL